MVHAVMREVREEVGIHLHARNVHRVRAPERHGAFRVRQYMTLWKGREEDVTAREGQQLIWIHPRELTEAPLSSSARAAMAAILLALTA